VCHLPIGVSAIRCAVEGLVVWSTISVFVSVVSVEKSAFVDVSIKLLSSVEVSEAFGTEQKRKITILDHSC
jgi:hypothetical protein